MGSPRNDLEVEAAVGSSEKMTHGLLFVVAVASVKIPLMILLPEPAIDLGKVDLSIK